MHIKGIEQLRKHLPDLNSFTGVVRFLSRSILLFILIEAWFTARNLIQPIRLLIGAVAFSSLGFFLVYQFVRKREYFKSRFGALAYSQAASRFGFPGVVVIFTVVAHIRSLSGPRVLPPGGWSMILTALGRSLIGVGALLILRVLQTFGVDNLTMLYVYFLEESQLVEHNLYNILRHPAYSAVRDIASGLALLSGNWFALACASFFMLSLWGWVRLVEEKELITRFGTDYLEYRQRVPAFWPRWHNLREFLEFLVIGR